MGIKSAILKNYARRVTRNTVQWSHHALESQEKMMKLLVNKASLTQFGKEHHFHKIVTHYDFSHLIPIHKVKQLSPYIQEIQNGKKDVLWPGKPRVFIHDGKNTADLIPVTKESISGYFDGLKMLLFNQFDWIDKHKVFRGKALFLAEVQADKRVKAIPQVKFDWIYTQKVPAWLKGNIIWSEHISQIFNPEDIRLIVGSPQKLVNLKDQILKETSKKSLRDIFPNLSTVVWVIEHPAQLEQVSEFEKETGLSFLKMYVSAMGCWAFQDMLSADDCLLNVNSGLFFEFMPFTGLPDEKRLHVGAVEKGVPYKLIISNNAGCWSVDTELIVRITHTNPYRIELIQDK